MKALWAAGPERCKVSYLRGPSVKVLPERFPLNGPSRDEVLGAEVWPVREIEVGHRRWRVIVPPEWSLSEALLALIDADPADARLAEVSL
jgi:hypothetical protein